jgi:PAB1-binding protein PBP1
MAETSTTIHLGKAQKTIINHFFTIKSINMNTQFANKIDLVRNSFPSVFSKDDVIKLIEDLSNETESTQNIQQHLDHLDKPTQDARILIDEEIEELSSRIVNKLSRMGTELISDFDLSISGREIEMDSIDIDEYEAQERINNVISDYISELKAELEKINA